MQPSPTVHELPSSQVAVLGVARQAPLLNVQLSSVHGLASSQFLVEVPWQTPPWHASPSEQALPSSHVASMGKNTQPCAGLQLSVVQMLLSSQVTGLAWQSPLTQLSPAVQALPSLQRIPPSFLSAHCRFWHTPTWQSPWPGQLPSSVAPSQSLSVPSQISVGSLVGTQATHAPVPEGPSLQNPELQPVGPLQTQPIVRQPLLSPLPSPAVVSSSVVALVSSSSTIVELLAIELPQPKAKMLINPATRL